MSAITIHNDLRSLFGTARDQGGRETCLAFATSDAHAAILDTSWSPLSCEYLFYHAKQRDGTSPHSGTTVTAIRAALRDDGQPAEAGWPYLAALPAELTQWQPPADVGALHLRNSTTKTAAFDEVWDAIDADQPAVIGMTFSTAFFTPATGGVVHSAEPEDMNLRHAVVAVATGVTQAERHVLVRNSWGTMWGLSGHAWLSETYLAPRVKAVVILD